MSNDTSVHENHIESKTDTDVLKLICICQESNPSESLIILQAFLHLINPIHQQEYSDDFIQYQLDLLKRYCSSSTPLLFEILKQIVPTSELILLFNSIRESIVESFLNQFRKDTQKQKWGGNGEKIYLLGCLLKRSLKLYYSNENLIKNTIHIYHSIVLHLFEPLINELNDYLKTKLDKQQQQYSSLSHLIKPLGQLCEQLNEIDENNDCMIIKEYFSDIILAVLHQKIDFIINKKNLDHFDSFEKLEEYKCPIRQSIFFIYPEIHKLLTFLDDAKVSKNGANLIKKCNDKFGQLLEKASNIFHNYPSSTSLEHCICLISSLASIEILFSHDQFQYFLYNFCQFILTYWQINLLHDCDADDWLNTKSYFENTRYSVYIDTLFSHFNRFYFYIKRYCPNLLAIIIPYMLIELMNFIFHRYASIKISYARQNQYKTDLLAFLVHLSEFTHYFINQKTSNKQFLLFKNDQIESKFFEYGNGILASIVLVTCPCDLLYEQLESLLYRSTKLSTKMNWLNIIRPDWFDINYEIRSQVQTFLIIKNIIETRENNFPMNKLLTIVIENAEFDSHRSIIIHLIMQYEQWELINLFVKHELDWSFLNTQSTKLPEWLSKMMEYWKEFFAKCCFPCANEKEIEWRIKIQQNIIEEYLDEKSNYLKSLQQYIANIPISLYHLLCAINQYQPQFNKRSIFAHLLYKYMIDLKIDRASIYYSFLTDYEKNTHQTIERLLERKSPLFRFPHDQLNDEQTSCHNANNIVEILRKNFDSILSRLDVKTLDEYYNTPHSYSQLFTQQQRQFAHSIENLNVTPSDDDLAFTDLNLRQSKRNIHTIIPTFKIDYTLVNRIELNWPTLFTHIIVRLKSSIIYHFITLRFEFQSNASSSLNDTERLAVGKLIELLPPFFNEKK